MTEAGNVTLATCLLVLSEIGAEAKGSQAWIRLHGWVSRVPIVDALSRRLWFGFPREQCQQRMSESLCQLIEGAVLPQEIDGTDERAHDHDRGHVLVEIFAEDASLDPVVEQIFGDFQKLDAHALPIGRVQHFRQPRITYHREEWPIVLLHAKSRRHESLEGRTRVVSVRCLCDTQLGEGILNSVSHNRTQEVLVGPTNRWLKRSK